MAHVPDIDATRFRRVLGHFPTGVTVVTAAGEPPCGMAIGSFASVSLSPSLVGFFVASTSSSWPTIRDRGSFCVNVLADDQQDLCRTFAGKAADRFVGVDWRSAGSGAPILAGAIAWVDCDIHDVVAAGDHDLVLGRVRDLDAASDGAPLIFFQGAYSSVSMAVPQG